MRCRACDGTVISVVDLGLQPSSGAFPQPDDAPGLKLPLRLGMCDGCRLVQLADPSPPNYDDSGTPSPLMSPTIVSHARGLVDDLASRGLFSPESRILLAASHGGHPTAFFRERGLATTILEDSTIRARSLRGFGQAVLDLRLDETTSPDSGVPGSFDLITDLYLLNHLDRPHLALERLASLLAPRGTLVIDCGDFATTVQLGEWDSVGHGHPVYFTLGWLVGALRDVGLQVFDVAPQNSIGRSFRVYARARARAGPMVSDLLAREAAAAIDRPAGLAPLMKAVEQTRSQLVPHLLAAQAAGRRVVGYGAPERSITLLNVLGIGPELLPYVVDRAPAKQGRTIPGTGIPIRPPEFLAEDLPEEVLILVWYLAAEVRRSLAPLLPRARFVVPMPHLAEVTDIDEATSDRSSADGMRS